MTKNAKEKKVNSLVGGYLNGYHGGSFRTLRLYTSDRYIECIIDDNGNLVERKTMKIKKGFGLEIETENFAISNSDVLIKVYKNMVFNMFHEDLFKYERDGSLCSGLGCECITQVMTKEFIRNNYAKWKELFNRFEMVKTSATQSGNCGMHVNISNSAFGRTKEVQYEALRKLYYIINNKFYKLMARCFNRDLSHCGYCRQTSYNPLDKNQWERYILQDTSHGNSMNYSHIKEGRVEIRLVGGQNNYNCFRNTMEVVFHLVERVQTIAKKDLDNIVEIFKGCNKYVYSRLERCKNEGYLSEADYNKIGENVDYTQEYI